MNRTSTGLDIPTLDEPLARLPALEEALELRKTTQILEIELQRLDSIGADVAAAHLVRALDCLRDRFNSNLNFTRMDAPLHGHEVSA